MGVDQQRLDEIKTIAGFLIPVWRSDPIPGQPAINGLTEEDFAKVAAGYACGECLADYGAIYRPSCPICGTTRDVSADAAPMPQVWADHLDARQEADEHIAATPMPTMEQVIRSFEADPDRVNIKKLAPSKWGRGRTE